MRSGAALALVLLLIAGGALAVQLVSAGPETVELAAYATSLQGRTASQRYNARLAARALDGQIIHPGAVFSFNQTVKPWTIDQGYVKAPVSFDGELVSSYGGGVCQTSTTLYNTALLAGLPVLERHPHVYVPSYVTPGRDAAVAQYTVDLRLRNPYPWPVRIEAHIVRDRLEVRLVGKVRPSASVQIRTEVIGASTPARLTQVDARGSSRGRVFRKSLGATGYRVITYRIFYQDDRELRREHLSDDTYRPMDRVVLLGEPNH
jgi:vancomycin resistance protein YoaR